MRMVAVGVVWMAAQTAVVCPVGAQEAAPAEEPVEGWTPELDLVGTFAYDQAANVPGAVEGTSLQVGSVVHAAAEYVATGRRHRWKSVLDWGVGFSRTPQIDAFIKSRDAWALTTDYRYFFTPRYLSGTFVSAAWLTRMLRTEEVRPTDTTVVHLDENGAVRGDPQQVAAQRPIPLSDPLTPTTLRQGVGLFLTPLRDAKWELEMRIGLSAWEVLAKGAYTVQDDADTPELELRRVADSVQGGVEAKTKISGVQAERIAYGFSALVMQPLWSSGQPDDVRGVELLNVELSATLGITLADYLSVAYAFTALRQPTVVSGWQVQSSLVLQVGLHLRRSDEKSQ